MLQSERKSTPLYKKIIMITLSILMLTIQIALFALAIAGSFPYAKILYFIGLILSIGIIFYIINSHAPASYKITWIALISILPLFFSYLYILNFSARRLPKRKKKKLDDYIKSKELDRYSALSEDDHNINRLANLIYEESNYLMYNNTKVKFFNDAALKHQDMLKKIKAAEKYIFMEYFIVSDGSLLDELIPILAKKGEEGVEIKLLYDDLGSKATLSSKTIDRFLAIPNLKICVYAPMGFNLNPSVNYRDHRKMTIIDGKYAYCGGDNLADEYIHKKDRFGYWRDNAILLEGSAVFSFILMFSLMWYASSKEYIDIAKYTSDYEVSNPDEFVIPFADGPNTETDVAYHTFQYMIQRANKTLYISTPYFIIDDEMISTIVRAKKSGVDVKILVPGIPDKKMVFMMTRAHYREILECGCEIYEYTKGFNHAKNIIVDGKYAFCGTINMDYRSLFLHFECGAVFSSKDVVKDMEDDFLSAVKESKLITLADWQKRNVFSKIFTFLVKIFAPML